MFFYHGTLTLPRISPDRPQCVGLFLHRDDFYRIDDLLQIDLDDLDTRFAHRCIHVGEAPQQDASMQYNSSVIIQTAIVAMPGTKERRERCIDCTPSFYNKVNNCKTHILYTMLFRNLSSDEKQAFLNTAPIFVNIRSGTFQFRPISLTI